MMLYLVGLQQNFKEQRSGKCINMKFAKKNLFCAILCIYGVKRNEVNANYISNYRELEDKPLESALERLEYVAVIFYDETDSSDLQILAAHEKINDECKQNDIRLVKTSDDQLRKDTGIPDDSPILIYYENDVPFLYNVHPLDPEEVDETLHWIIEQRNTAAIEEVTDSMLEDIIEDNEYVVVLFIGGLIGNFLVKLVLSIRQNIKKVFI